MQFGTRLSIDNGNIHVILIHEITVIRESRPLRSKAHFLSTTMQKKLKAIGAIPT
jgi:hypothetical protein